MRGPRLQPTPGLGVRRRLVLALAVAAAALLATTPAAVADCVGKDLAGGNTVTLLGDGTAQSPYLVGTPQGLSAVGTNTCAASASYLLTADLTMPTATTSGTTTSNFRRIGSLSGGFGGTFDGGGHTITDLRFSDATLNEVALFKTLVDGATVRDLTLSGANLSGQSAVGALVGATNCNGTAAITISGVTAIGSVTAAQDEAGGLVGFVMSCIGAARVTVRDSWSGVAVTGSGTATGGAIGRAHAVGSGSILVDGVTATGVVQGLTGSSNRVGGLVGSASIDSGIGGPARAVITIVDSQGTGLVSAPSGQDVGGLVGFAGASGAGNSLAITRSQAGGSTFGVSGRQGVGGLVGWASAGAGSTVAITDSFARGTVTATTSLWGGLIGLFSSPNLSPGTLALTRVYASGAVSPGGSGLLGGTITPGPIVPTSALWDTEATGRSASGVTGALGVTTAQLQSPAVLAAAPYAWPIVPYWQAPGSGRTWGVCASVNGGYPFLLVAYDETPCLRPDQLTGLTATAGDASAVIAFTAGDPGDAPITGYEASVDEGAWVAVSGAASPVTVTGLANGRAQSIRLRAVSAVGPGLDPSDPVIVTPQAAPAAVAVAAAPKAAAVLAGRPAALAGGRVRVAVRATGAGVIAVTGRRGGGRAAKPACSATRRVAKAGTYALVCRADRATRALLASRAVTLRVTASFRPTGGSAVTETATVVLPRAARR